MSEIDRLYKYNTLLSGRRAVPRDELMHKLEISLATLKRDLAKLRDQLHIPIVYDRDLGGYRLEATDSTELPGMWFSENEIHALLTMHQLLAGLDDDGVLSRHLQPMLERLQGMLGADAAESRRSLELDDDLIHREAFAGSGRHLPDLAVLVGLENVFHLHRFDDRQLLAGLHFLTDLDGDFAEQAGHRREQEFR